MTKKFKLSCNLIYDYIYIYWRMNGCPRHLPFKLFVDKLYLKFYNYMCVNGYAKMCILERKKYGSGFLKSDVELCFNSSCDEFLVDYVANGEP